MSALGRWTATGAALLAKLAADRRPDLSAKELSHRTIGGLTGDTLGAMEQVVECAVLVAVGRLELHHELGWR